MAPQFTQVQAQTAVVQMCKTKNFANVILHLDTADIVAIKIGQWPDCPVYSPYKPRHDHYSKIRLSSTKKWTFMHAVAYQSLYGDLDPTLNASHTLYLGKHTIENINPKHLVLGPATMGSGRDLCAAHFENGMLILAGAGEEKHPAAKTFIDENYRQTRCVVHGRRGHCDIDPSHCVPTEDKSLMTWVALLNPKGR